MCIRYDAQIWFRAKDFQDQNAKDNFVGYEAGTDIAQLHRKHPSLFDARRAGKYIERRIRFEDPWTRGLLLRYGISTINYPIHIPIKVETNQIKQLPLI